MSDVGVLAGLHDDPAFVAELYAQHPIILFAHVDHPFARYDEVPLQAMQGQPLLRREQGSTTRLALERALETADISPRIAMEIGSREALREAVIRGIGIGVVSEAEYIADPRLKAIRIVGDPVLTETYLYRDRHVVQFQIKKKPACAGLLGMTSQPLRLAKSFFLKIHSYSELTHCIRNPGWKLPAHCFR